jgi:hypothetical protein
VKGVIYNPEYETWTAKVYRNGHCYRIGTYRTKEAAITAYEQALKEWPSQESRHYLLHKQSASHQPE